ncbi:hypothetical protein [Skermanella aerolata]|uniref:hypothetical protein n=1 Tax=Skermanella aerolata TaxID=393310 RepID=UPI003D1BDD02
MYVRKLLLSAMLAASLMSATAGAGLAAVSSSHQGHAGTGAAIAELTLNDGQKWPSDAALREGMTEIRATLRASLGQIHGGIFSAAEYAALADRVESQVDGLVRNCRLPPEADAQLHLVIADILDGAEMMRKDNGRIEGAIKLMRTLHAYGDYFDHPDWHAAAN